MLRGLPRCVANAVVTFGVAVALAAPQSPGAAGTHQMGTHEMGKDSERRMASKLFMTVPLLS